MIGIYHSKDLDGLTCGAIMLHRYPEIKLIGFDYGEDIWDKLKDYPPQPVIIADVSLAITEDSNEMMKLGRWCNGEVTWIDHHKSAIEAFEQTTGPRQPGVYVVEGFGKVVVEIGRAACEIAWEYLLRMQRRDPEMPEAIKLLGEYDTWRNQDKEHWENEVMPFQYGMRMHCTSPESFPTSVFVNGKTTLEAIKRDGMIILRYQKQMNERAASMTAFELNFEGYRAICMNNGGANSQLFASVYDEAKHDIMLPFVYNGKYWVFSIYSTNPAIDCSVLAKKYGGGGHRQAAGFQIGAFKIIDGELFIVEGVKK